MSMLNEAQSQISQDIFQQLENAIRTKNPNKSKVGNRAKCLIMALHLFTWLHTGREEGEDIATSEAAEVCRQYLLEYIFVLSSHLRIPFANTLAVLPKSTANLYNASKLDLIALVPKDICPFSPRPVIRMFTDARTNFNYQKGNKVQKLSVNPSTSVENFRLSDKCWCDGPQELLQGYLMLLWTLFRDMIPELMIHRLDYDESEFFGPLVRYGNGSPWATSHCPLPNKTWSEWMKEAQLHRERINMYVYAALDQDLFSSGDRSLLVNFNVVLEFPHMSRWLPSNVNPPKELKSVFRWIFLENLGSADLIDAASLNAFINEMKVEAPDLFKSFIQGFGIASRIREGLR